MDKYRYMHLCCPNCGITDAACFEGTVCVRVTLNGGDASVADSARFFEAHVDPDKPMKCLECGVEIPAKYFIQSGLSAKMEVEVEVREAEIHLARMGIFNRMPGGAS